MVVLRYIKNYSFPDNYWDANLLTILLSFVYTILTKNKEIQYGLRNVNSFMHFKLFSVIFLWIQINVLIDLDIISSNGINHVIRKRIPLLQFFIFLYLYYNYFNFEVLHALNLLKLFYYLFLINLKI